MEVFDNDGTRKDVQKYNLKKQYKKTCNYIREGQYQKVQLKLRKPKKLGIYQFRISKKYRAFAIKKNNALFVFEISDHQ